MLLSSVRPGTCRTATFLFLLAFLVIPVTAEVYFTPSAPGIITKGDPFSISGTGAVNGTIGIWLVGRDHFEILTIAPDRHGNFSVTIKPSATDGFSSGQYAILFQDPGKSGVLEIEGGTDVNDNLVVMNRGKIIARLGNRQHLGENIRPVVDQIQAAASAPGADDTFRAEYFFVEEPAIFFTRLIPASGFRLPDKITGERIVISGTTNIGIENTLSTEIRSQKTKEIVTVKSLPVTAGNPMNIWEWNLDVPGLPPGDYEITIGWAKSNITGLFTVKNPAPPSSSPGKPPYEKNPPPADDYTFPIFVGASLVVLAIVLYYAGRE